MSQNTHVGKDRVLIVDDTRTIIQILTMILEKEGIDIETASSGEEALEKLKNTHIDTILLDIQMGKGIDGFETCRRIKANPKTKDIPVIFLTAFDDNQSKMKGFAAGGIDFISKNFDKNEIISRVKNQTSLFKMQVDLQKGFAYIRAILDAQQQMIAIFDADFRLENYNKSFRSKFDTTCEEVLCENLSQYDHYKLPDTDREFLTFLSEYSDFKAGIKGLFGVYSFELTDTEVLNERKHILTISDITVYEVVKKQEIELFKFKERYHNVQQQDAFKKQKKIIKDQVSHLSKNGWLFDSYYKPLDILSGDTLGAIKVNDMQYLFYIVDAMGKGLSASVTSIQSTSFINNSIERASEKGDFNLRSTIESFCAFIRKQLLDDELLCAVFVEFDMAKDEISIINYGMPPLLIEESGSVRTIKPNNPPIMQFFSTCNVETVGLGSINKIALYSDGLNEAQQKDGSPFGKHIEEDFKNSSLMKQFLELFKTKTKPLDDDLTLIYISKHIGKKTLFSSSFTIDAKISQIAHANEKVETILTDMNISQKDASEVLLIFNELIMNSFEHGSLKLDSAQKEKLIEEDKYEEYLYKAEENLDLSSIKIDIALEEENYGFKIIKISIEDSGEGFEFSETLKTIYMDEDVKYSGRGVWMAKDLTDGIYFNERGNRTTFLKTVKVN